MSLTVHDAPTILDLLDSDLAFEREQGATLMAKLVDSTAMEEAVLLSDYLRGAGALVMLLELVDVRDLAAAEKVHLPLALLSSCATLACSFQPTPCALHLPLAAESD